MPTRQAFSTPSSGRSGPDLAAAIARATESISEGSRVRVEPSVGLVLILEDPARPQEQE